MEILFVMGFSQTDGVPVRHRKIFPSSLAELAQSSSRMSMERTRIQAHLKKFAPGMPDVDEIINNFVVKHYFLS